MKRNSGSLFTNNFLLRQMFNFAYSSTNLPTHHFIYEMPLDLVTFKTNLIQTQWSLQLMTGFTTKMASFQIGGHFRLEFVICYSSLFLAAFISSVTNAQDSNPNHSSCSDLCDYSGWAKFANCSNRIFSSIPNICSAAKTLQLNNNRITRLDPDAFQDFTSLRYLYLRSSTLTDISPDAFRGLEELQYLRLGGNCFTNLNSEILRGLDNLIFLLVVEGCMQDIAAGTFEALPNLRTLELGGNRLREPLCDAFGAGNVLQALTVADNLIDSLPDFCFAELHLLRILNLDGNNLTEIRNGQTLSGLDNLQTISLEKTSLIWISNDSFKYTPQLRFISLARNGLPDLPPDVFHNLSYLTFINLSNNALERVTAKLFQNNLLLKVIDLTANRITQIEASSFTGLQNLSSLQLSSNRIKLISQLIQETPWIGLANLADNPLRCECAILDLGDWLDLNAEYATKCVFSTPSENKKTGEHSLQTLCDGDSHIHLTSSKSVTIAEFRLHESQESNLSLPTNEAASKSATKSDGHANIKIHSQYTSFPVNIIFVAITIVLPVVFIVIMFGIVYQCQKILKTSPQKYKDFITLSPVEDHHVGAIDVRRPVNLTQFNGLNEGAASDEMGGIGEDEGLYEEFPDLESKVDSQCLPKKVHNDTVHDVDDVEILTRSPSYFEVQNDTYVLYDPPRMPQRDYQAIDDQGKTATGIKSDYYVFGFKEPVYDSRIPKYANE